MKILNSERGAVLLVIALAIFLGIMILGAMFVTRTKSSSRLATSETAVTLGIETADVGIEQMLGDIHNKRNITPAMLKAQMTDLKDTGAITGISRYYQVRKSTSTGYFLWVTTATLTIVPRNNDPFTQEAEVDIENNPIYRIVSKSSIFLTSGEKIAQKTVKTMISIINLAKYSAVNIGTWRTGWYATANILDGYIHINPDLVIHGFNFVNCLYVPETPINFNINDISGSLTKYYLNPYYDHNYTVVTAGHIKKFNDHNHICPYRVYTHASDLTLSSPLLIITPLPIDPDVYEANYGRRAYYSHLYTPADVLIGPNDSGPTKYDIIKLLPGTPAHPNSNPDGTWFDRTHGGFRLNVIPLDYTFFRSYADVLININDISNCSVLGTTYPGTDLLIDLFDGPGATTSQAVEIDLGALGTGSSKDVCRGLDNYEEALSNFDSGTLSYGLVIYVNGPVALHGKLARARGAINQNKKVTIITTQGVNVIGDVLYSGDSYLQTLDSCDTPANWQATNGTRSAVLLSADTEMQNDAPFNNSELQATWGTSLKTSVNRGSKANIAQASFVKNNCLLMAPTTYDTIPPFNVPNNKVTLNLYLGSQAPYAQAKINLQLRDAANNLIKELPNRDAEQIVINEICYSPDKGNPDDPTNDYQWVEIFNRHPTKVYDLRDWTFDDGQNQMSLNSNKKQGDWLLGPGEYALLVKKWNGKFRQIYDNIPAQLDVIELDNLSLCVDSSRGISLIDPNGRRSEPSYFYTHPHLTNSGITPHPDWSRCSWERVNYYSTLPGIWEVNKDQSLYTTDSAGKGTPGQLNTCFRAWSRTIVTGLTASQSVDLNNGSVSLIFSDYSRGTIGQSNDQANNWTNTNLTTATIYALAIHPTNADIVYAGTGGMGVFRTTNGGNNWTRFSDIATLNLTNADVYSLAIDPNDPNTIYAGTGGMGVFKTIDGGNNWAQLGSIISTHTVYALAIDINAVPVALYAGTDEQGVFKSSDDGLNWAPFNTGLPVPPQVTVYSLAVGPANTIYAGTKNSGVYFSNDGAATWNSGNGLAANAIVYVLAVNPADQTIVYCGTESSGTYRSGDSGATWAAINGGELDAKSVFSITRNPAGTRLSVATSNGIYTSDNEGGNWTNAAYNNTIVNALAYAPNNTSRFYAGTSSNIDFFADELTYSLGKSFPLNARFTTEGVFPGPSNPANLNNDGLAIISNDNVSIDLWRLNRRGHFNTQWGSDNDEYGVYVPPEYESTRLFVNNGDYQLTGIHRDRPNINIYNTGLKMSGFFYCNTDRTGISFVQLTLGGFLNPRYQMVFESRYGTVITKSTGYRTSEDAMSNYDADLDDNVSSIIPIGTGIHSWQQVDGE